MVISIIFAYILYENKNSGGDIMDTYINAISNVGFPIVACGAMAWFCYKLIMNKK
jgi:hypothetical protein